MPESPVVSVEHLPTAVIMHVMARELRKSEVDAICGEVDKARVAAPSLPFILDMAAVYFAGSLAFGTLVGLSQEFRTRAQRLIFVGFQQDMRRAIDILRIGRIMEIEQDVAAAMHSIGGDT